MRRRDMLKMGLIVAAIPVGINMLWKRSSLYRQSHIRKRVREVLGYHMDTPSVHEAMAFVDDVLDLTFSIVPEGIGELAEGPALNMVRHIDHTLVAMGEEPLVGREKVAMGGVYNLIGKNYSHQVSEEALEVLYSVGVSAKVYQMRPEMYL